MALLGVNTDSLHYIVMSIQLFDNKLKHSIASI